jgi:hypothetical protein
MTKEAKRFAIMGLICGGDHARNHQEALVYQEVWAVYDHKYSLKDTIAAMDNIIRAARSARTKLRRLL